MGVGNSAPRGRMLAAILANVCLIGLLWGFAEGALFFVVPDVIISLAAIFSWRHFLTCAGAALAGSIIGGLAIFLGAQYQHDVTGRLVHLVPFIPQRMFDRVDADYGHEGIWSLFNGPVSGIPYKVYALFAPAYVGLLPFLLVSVPVRLGRFLVVGGLARIVALAAAKYRQLPPEKLVPVHGLLWTVFYLFYWYKTSGG